MPEEFKRNEKYDQNDVTKLIHVYHMALDANDNETVQEILSRIYNFTEKFVYKTLWDNYKSIMKNPSHREDLTQEVWARIFKELKNYDPDKAAITTFIAPWIRHVVADYVSKNFRNASVYYANAMQQVTDAQNYCKATGLNANDMDMLVRLTGLSEMTVKHALDLMAKKDSVSYESLLDVGDENVSAIKGPEESVLESESERELMDLCRSILTDREMMFLSMLVNPDQDGKRHSSYREMMDKLPGSNIPQIKKEVSKMFAKITTNPKFMKLYPYVAHQARALEDNYIPVLDSDDQEEIDTMFDSFVSDLDKKEEDGPQVQKICSAV